MERNNSSAAVLDSEAVSLRRIRYRMGGLFEIEAAGEDQSKVREAVEKAFLEIKRIEQDLSRFLPESAVSEVNRRASRVPVPVPGEVFDLMEQCVHFSKLTGGAFEITACPFTELWHSAEKRGRKPSRYEIKEASLCVGSSYLNLDRGKKTLFFSRPGMKIDLGAAGKGYAVDRAVQVLRDCGIRKGLVSAGSTVFCLDESPSRFGITHPLQPEEMIASVELCNRAVSTSANYERSFKIGRRTYGHLMDPRTGFPAKGSCLSVSILGPSAMECDILSTAVFVLGKEKGRQLIKSLQGFESVLVMRGFFGASVR